MGHWEQFANGGEDFGEDFDGLELGDLGDLSDVSQSHLAEVVDVLRSLPGPQDDPGDITALRGWIHQIKRTAGFSREATVQLFSTIAQCLEANRPKGYNLPTREDLQKAFVRMQGVRETINIMLMRLSDPAVVAQAARTLAAGVQGSPLAAEAMFDDGTDRVRLMLRSMERHDTNSSVVENACLFISHLCSLTAWPGAPAPHARVKAHRDIQSTLVLELGVIDLLVHFLEVSVVSVKDLAMSAEGLHKKTMDAKNSLALPKPGSQTATNMPGQTAAGLKENVALQDAWLDLHIAESSGARIQELSLQALLLLAFGNADTTRQLAGELWVWGNSHQADTQEDASKKPNTAPSGMSRAQSQGKLRPKAKPKQKGKKQAQKSEEPVVGNPWDAALEGGVKSSLTTLDAFAKVSKLLIEVLTGRCARDRPALAAKAIRILAVLAEHSIQLLRHIEAGQQKQHAEMVLKMRPGTVPTDNQKPHAPFATMKELVSALMLSMRVHRHDAPLLHEALSMLMKLKQLAMLAAPPAGVAQRGENLLYAWQHLLAETEKSGEIEAACSWLKQALQETDVANDRVRVTGARPEHVAGDISYLTPRLHEAVLRTTSGAAELVGDALASRWRNGEPGRHNRKFGDQNASTQGEQPSIGDRRKTVRQPTQKLAGVAVETIAPASEPSPKAGRAKARAKTVNLSKQESHSDRKSEGRRRASTTISGALADSLNQLSEAGLTPETKQLGRSKTEGKLKTTSTEGKENAEGPEWIRALGFDTHDEEDFSKVWRDPLKDALQRSLCMQPVSVLRAQKRLESQLKYHPEQTLGEDAGGETAPRVFSSSDDVQMQLIESGPGILRAKLVLPSLDEGQYHAAEDKLRRLIGDHAGSEVSSGVSKHMRMQGYMLPTYGLQFQFKKGRKNADNT